MSTGGALRSLRGRVQSNDTQRGLFTPVSLFVKLFLEGRLGGTVVVGVVVGLAVACLVSCSAAGAVRLWV